ncbi:MAG: dihydroneopterin aldolase [Nitrososphaerota archaeon]|nr:dihydroneopterin aldolase [Nitrososphaerota archaeon]MDG7040148.1 dihydroneopterin aldolase [Nitrososphaerota archaeon]MDG7042073.1 dihydroneopterin aldolase [Nitrososphaerota archaeon]MDG7046269.1 dihydroneopterin aldolase [Nitrososphaerota archaeon]MDG7047984.1 dihydroneopterin aldolase [Nitrososphaerota archaeon]
MISRIVIRDLSLYCVIGDNEWERGIKQNVMVTIELWVNVDRALVSDQIADTVNYKKLKDKVVRVVESSSNRLLEALAYSIAKICLAEERVEKVKVTVDKPGALSYARSVAFELEMGR